MTDHKPTTVEAAATKAAKSIAMSVYNRFESRKVVASASIIAAEFAGMAKVTPEAVPAPPPSPTIAEPTPEQLVELRKWWDAFGSDNTPEAINKMCDEYLLARKQVADCGQAIEALQRQLAAASAENERMNRLLQRCRSLCEHCGGTGLEPPDMLPAGKCHLCEGDGYFDCQHQMDLAAAQEREAGLRGVLKKCAVELGFYNPRDYAFESDLAGFVRAALAATGETQTKDGE